MKTIINLVRAYMLKFPERFSEKPQAYKNRAALVNLINSRLERQYSPETITRAQRKVWELWRQET